MNETGRNVELQRKKILPLILYTGTIYNILYIRAEKWAAEDFSDGFEFKRFTWRTPVCEVENKHTLTTTNNNDSSLS